jgi:hypothetical protein
VIRSALAEQAVSYRLSTREELEAISSAWRRWAEHDDAFFVVLHAELIARVGTGEIEVDAVEP